MARHLEPLGWDVDVLTTSVWGAERGDVAAGVHRTQDLVAHPLLRRALRRGAVAAPGGAPPLHSAPPPALLRAIVPDATAVSWLPAAARRARQLMRTARFDCIVTTSPPESAHLLALTLGRMRPAWIVDLRDPWTTPGFRIPFPTRAQRALDRALERRVVDTADAVVAVHEATAIDLANRCRVAVQVLPNGWDPVLAEALVPVAPKSEVFTVVHTGTMAAVPGRDPRAFLRAVARVAAEPGPRPLRLVLAGSQGPEDRALLDDRGLDGVVDHLGTLPHGESLGLQRAADLLVVLAAERSTAAPAKVYEYLAADRPVLVLGAASESARIVEGSGMGVAARIDDEDAIADVLRRGRRRELVVAPRADTLDRYRYPALAERMANVLEAALASRARGTA